MKKILMGLTGLTLVSLLSGCAQSTANSVVNSDTPFNAGVGIGQAIGRSLWGGK